jgi:spoIIIJ-associated protein
MSSRERRMLHLAFRQFDDLETESSGEGLRRFVVVYRKGDKHIPPVAAAPSFQRGGRGGGRDSRGGGRGPGRGSGRDDRRGPGNRDDRRGPRGPRR